MPPFALVTGATGFIGSHLAERLLREGWHVKLLVRDAGKLFPDVRRNCTIITGDLADTNALAEAVSSVSVIFHCAGNVHTWDAPHNYEKANIDGVKCLLQAIAKHHPPLSRLVHLSTVDVYGFPEMPANESTATRSTGFGYGDSKIKGEQLVRELCEEYRIPYTILRPCNVIGKNSPFIERMGEGLRSGLMLTINAGQANAGITFIDDLVEYMLWVATSPVAAGQCYNVRSPYDITWKVFITALRAAIHGKGLVINLPYAWAQRAAVLCAILYRFILPKQEPLLHPLIVQIFGRTCGHSADKIRHDSGIISSISFEEAVQRSVAKNGKHVVFLQGMPCAFFSQLSRKLHAMGCATTVIHLCPGDTLFWRGTKRVPYRGTLAEWPTFIARFFQENKITDLVLLGEQRKYHKEAIAAAKSLGVAVTVTDFGYLRPDWLTLERDGMNGNSLFPKQPEAIAALAQDCPPVDLRPRYHDSNLNMSLGDVLYSFSNVLLGFLYPHYRQSDNRPHPLRYFPSMGLRMLRAKQRERHASQQLKQLHASNRRYYLFPLQLEHDFQITAYSPFATIAEAIELTLASFSRHAPKDTMLVFKTHPWDPGFTDWPSVIASIAQKYTLSDRVICVDGGRLSDMVAKASGMVTINSTSGLQALQQQCPVVTLAPAIYNIPGLTHQDELDRFWESPTQPEAAQVAQFIRSIAGTIQIRGVFFSEPGRSAGVREAAWRIMYETVGQTL